MKIHNQKLGGFTLFEVLIATAVTMILMVGLSQIFRVLGNSITKGRAGLELNNRIRNVALRIRTDLDNLTVSSQPGSLSPPISSQRGYLKYYDGPMTDFTLSRIDPSDTNPANGLMTNNAQSNPLLSRYGDLDDIFTATIQASDTWFTGKIPRFILEGRTGAAIDENSNGLQDELNDRVTITSQFAEIVIFAQPYSRNLKLPSGADTGVPEAVTTVTKAAPGTFEDTFSGISSATDDIPDQFRLYYRQLLIRDDLNLPSGVLPHSVIPAGNSADTVPTSNRAFVVGRNENLFDFLPNGATYTLPSPECDMFRIHQYCDLSVRRINDFDPSTLDTVAANSVQDLADQTSENSGKTAGGAANRFAHIQHQLTNVLWTMPVLSLSPCLRFQGADNTMVAKTGFLHPTFVLMGNRQGEDLLSGDLLAFDIKGFDPRAPFVSDTSRAFVLRPGDPGFGEIGIATFLTSTNPPIAFGDFVDVGWGDTLKLTVPASVTSYVNQARFITGELSCVTVDSSTLQRSPIASLVRSGNYLTNPAGNLLVYQPCFDTYSNKFQNDFILQGELLGGSSIGCVQFRGPNPPSPPDLVRPEYSAPLSGSLRGIQVSVRLEDKATKQFRQMSTIKQFMAN